VTEARNQESAMSDELNYTPAGGPYTPAPDPSQQVSQMPPASQPPQHEIYDPPIEHDPIGQALVGLPAALLTGVGEGVAEGAGMLASVGKEVFSWGAAELGIGAGESLLEPGPGGEGAGGAGGAPAGSEPDASIGGGDSQDAGTGADTDPQDTGAGGDGDTQDPGVCEEPQDQGDGGYSAE
jgi:hypothetical protein